MGDRWVSPCGRMDLRCGDWREVLADVEKCDAVITDPPYSERCVLGYRSGSDPAGGSVSYNIPYAALTTADASDLSEFATKLARRWFVAFGDHVVNRWLEREIVDRGWYVFAPIPWCRTDAPPRMNGDGPASATEWITVSRPRKKLGPEHAGSRPGYYVCPGTSASRHGEKPVVTGQKSLTLMRAIVRDYSIPGDLIVEPYAGGGTTLLAAAMEGRRAIGAELDPETYRKAVKRLSAGYTGRLFA